MTGDVRLPMDNDHDGRMIGFAGSKAPAEREWWRIDAGQLVTIGGSMIGALIVVLAAWFTLKAEVAEAQRQIVELRGRAAVVEQTQNATAIAVAKLETKLDAKLDGVSAQLADVKAAINRVLAREDARGAAR